MTARPRTLAEAARIAREEPGLLDLVVAEFLDEFYAHPESRQAAIDAEPVGIGRVEDAWLAAVAEHLARRWHLRIPDWVEAPHRFLSEPHFAGGLESLKAILLAESPLAFRRRLIFVEADPLRRARMPREPAGA
jgi:hypothetical protein